MTDEFPAGWHKTIAELVAKAKESGRSVGSPEVDWARAFERSLLRPWARFPLNGDVYEAIDDTPVSFLTHWSAPFTGGGTGVLPKGTRVRVRVLDHMPEPVLVSADPIDHEAIERLMVPEDTRNAHKYGSFSLSIPTADLNRRFLLVSTSSRSVAVQQSLEGSVRRFRVGASGAGTLRVLGAMIWRFCAAPRLHR